MILYPEKYLVVLGGKAIGYRFIDKQGNLLKDRGEELSLIETIDRSQVDTRIQELEVIVACDGDNPLLGEKGDTMVYGPQKGASKEILLLLEEGMINYAKKMEVVCGRVIVELPGSGAAGGLGAGLIAGCNAILKSGFQMICEAIDFQ